MNSQHKTFSLDGFLPYKLSLVSQSVSRMIAQEYENKFGLSMTQWRVLVIICNSPPLTANDIGAKSLLDKMTISRAVKSLRERSMINAKLVETDGRKRLLSVTALGRQIYEDVLPIALSYENELLNSITDSERETLEKILEKLLQKTRAL